MSEYLTIDSAPCEHQYVYADFIDLDEFGNVLIRGFVYTCAMCPKSGIQYAPKPVKS